MKSVDTIFADKVMVSARDNAKVRLFHTLFSALEF
jgi:hypothetical protein